jgi:preprotein translocase subunit SecD
VGRPFAIVVDDRVLSVSVIREPILGGSGQISGDLTLEDANTIAMLLRSGTLPGRLSVAEQRVVEPAGKAGKQ